MSGRIFGLISLAAAGVLLLLAAFMLAAGSTQAQTVAALPAAPGLGSAPAGVWADIAPFPSVTVSPTPGVQSLHIKRGAGACYFPNGDCYVLGGRIGADGQDTALSTIWQYAPGNPGTWTQKSAQVDPGAQGEIYGSNMAAAVLTDPTGVRIYAISGSSINSEPTNTVRIYDPVADTLSTLTTDPWPANPVRVPGGWAVYNNSLYLFGGFSSIANGGTGGVFTDTWKFDPMAAPGSKWTQLPSGNLNLGRGYMPGAELDGFIYAIGGDVWQGTPRALVPVTNVERMDVRTPNQPWTVVASLPTARGDMGAWAYDTGAPYEIAGKVAVAGGHYDVPDAQGYLYTPGSNAWAVFPNLVHATRNYAVGQLNGFLYAFGGYDYSNNMPDAANFSQRYDATGPVGTPTPTPCTISFVDVPPTDPFFFYIRCLACRQIISGYTTSPPCGPGGIPCYNGGATITRGQVAKIVSNAAGFNDPIPSTQQTFGDVPGSNPFWLYIERVALHGVISGYSASPPCPAGQVPCFLPGNPVTRGQIAKIDANAAGYADAIPSTTQTFTDVPFSNPFWLYVERASLHGVISGYSTNPPCSGGVPCFLPGNNLNRNQTAKIVANTFFPNCQTLDQR